MSMDDQYVILEFNQASRQPRLAFGDVYDRIGDAVQDAQALLADNRKTGRRERFAVASIDIEWDSAGFEFHDAAKYARLAK